MPNYEIAIASEPDQERLKRTHTKHLPKLFSGGHGLDRGGGKAICGMQTRHELCTSYAIAYSPSRNHERPDSQEVTKGTKVAESVIAGWDGSVARAAGVGDLRRTGASESFELAETD